MEKNKQRKQIRIVDIFIIIIIVLGICLICCKFIHFGNVEYTNNAQVKQHIIPVNTRVQGYIQKVFFNEYEYIKKGDTLVIINDAEYRLRLAQAEADYQNALAGKSVMNTTISTAYNNIIVSDAGIDEARIVLENAEREYKRYENLLKQDAVTQQQYDAVKTSYDAAKARYEQLLRQKKSTTLIKDEQQQRLAQYDANIKLAEAALELARLNLSYTVILTSNNGYAGRKNIHEGQLVQAGQALLNLVNNDEKWIIANYKETQTSHIKEGQLVELKIDAISGTKFKGIVKSISDATGASYSLIPQDNSAGNFVKVEQRIPIRIEFTEDNAQADLDNLRSGMNVECFVKY